MHAILFGLKRAHHGSLRLTRKALTTMGLTAARFDLLFAIRSRRNGLLQTALRRMLGVNRTTASRMLASLERLGLVTREVDREDRRRKRVRITSTGRWRVAVAFRTLALSGWIPLVIESALCEGASRYRWWNAASCDVATAELTGALHRMRRAFRDRATLDYDRPADWPVPPDPSELAFLDIREEPLAASASASAETETETETGRPAGS